MWNCLGCCFKVSGFNINLNCQEFCGKKTMEKSISLIWWNSFKTIIIEIKLDSNSFNAISNHPFFIFGTISICHSIRSFFSASTIWTAEATTTSCWNHFLIRFFSGCYCCHFTSEAKKWCNQDKHSSSGRNVWEKSSSNIGVLSQVHLKYSNKMAKLNKAIHKCSRIHTHTQFQVMYLYI